MVVFVRRAELAARCLALIRLWPNLPSDGPDATECAALAVASLEQGVLWSQPQHLIQAAQALSVPALRKVMCVFTVSPSVCPSPSVPVSVQHTPLLLRPICNNCGEASALLLRQLCSRSMVDSV